MNIVKVSYSVSDKGFEEIKQFVNNELLNNPGLNGWEFEIDRGDFTEIDCDDENNLDVVGMFKKIQDIADSSLHANYGGESNMKLLFGVDATNGFHYQVDEDHVTEMFTYDEMLDYVMNDGALEPKDYFACECTEEEYNNLVEAVKNGRYSAKYL